MATVNNELVADAIDALTKEVKLCGMSSGDISALLGISQSYLRQLRHMSFNAKDDTVKKIELATIFLREHGHEFKEKYSKEALLSGKYHFLQKLREEFYASNNLV